MRFRPEQHIRSPRDFERIRRQGRRLVRGCLILNWTEREAGEPSRLGLVAGRRIGPAVVRNRARRLLRETFRLNQHRLCRPLDLVLIARASIVSCHRRQVEADLLQALDRAGLIREAP